MTPTVRHVRIRRLVIDRPVAGSAPLDRDALAAAIGRALNALDGTPPAGQRIAHQHQPAHLAALIAGGLSGPIERSRRCQPGSTHHTTESAT